METFRLTKNRIKDYLSNGKRLDGRDADEFREIVIETGISKKAEGSARVKIGKTEVLVGIKMDVGTPYPDSKDAGNLMVTAELLPLSSDRFESGPPRFEGIELGRITDRGIRESKFIDLKKLCIIEGEKVWNIFIDIYSINDDGNLMDAASIGALVALRDTKIPKYDEKEGKVIFGEWTKDKLPLSKAVPLSCTIHKVGNCLIVDPNREEEDASETRVTLALSDGNVVHSMQKGNEKEFEIEEFNNALDLAEKNYKKLYPLIKKYIE
ncbi:RNA-binding protein [Candidatus Pacearchaeota archaeon CG10_big_fil_rev_8_21_14_0_10_32_14]|nr:MAG: RNA-binding protein [Candidatus Pacearchaeota archaeon CG10_big_fil_rev_8_21_14_0_10_32_14]